MLVDHETDCCLGALLKDQSGLRTLVSQMGDSESDPTVGVQGPYTREAIKTWNESGYFPPELPLTTSRSDPHWHPLSQLLILWKTPRADSFLPHQASGQVNQKLLSKDKSKISTFARQVKVTPG